MAELCTQTGAGSRAVLLRVLAKSFGPGIAMLAQEGVGERAALLAAELGEPALAAALGEAVAGVTETVAQDGAEALPLAWVRWFDHGRVPPYELSNLPTGGGGATAALADIAGFYRAFGLRCPTDRPDHLVAEVELLSVALDLEARARSEGDDEAAQRCAQAARLFLRDHLGRWPDAFAARVAAVDGGGPWAWLARAIALAVAAECRHANVVPVRTDTAFGGGVENSFDDDAPACESGLVAG